MTSGSSVIPETITAASKGWTIYGTILPFRSFPSCTFLANSAAFFTIAVPSPGISARLSGLAGLFLFLS